MKVLKSSIEIALEKLWNILIALLIGEVTTAFHYGSEKFGWLLIGLSAIIFVSLLIAILSLKLDREESENVSGNYSLTFLSGSVSVRSFHCFWY